MKITRWLNKTVILLSAIYLTSCATSIKQSETVLPYQMKNSNESAPEMEFIGYKCDSNILSVTADINTNLGTAYITMSPFDQWKAIQQTSAIKNIGQTLYLENIAMDKSYAYFGIYSLQELELYKAKTRYITFIEIAENKYTVDDNGINKNLYGIIGASFLGCGISFHALASSSYDSELKTFNNVMGAGLDIAGAAYCIAALAKSKTKSTLQGLYNIYIYDTQKKEITYKEPLSIYTQTEFEGSYFHDAYSKNIVHEYYGKIIANEFLKKYDELAEKLKLNN